MKESCLRVSYTNSAPCLVCCPYIFCRWRYVFCLPLKPKRLLHWGSMHIYEWQLLAACHHPEKLAGSRLFDINKEKLCENHESYKCVLPLKNWVGWITNQSMPQFQKCKFWKKGEKIKEAYSFSPYDYVL